MELCFGDRGPQLWEQKRACVYRMRHCDDTNRDKNYDCILFLTETHRRCSESWAGPHERAREEERRRGGVQRGGEEGKRGMDGIIAETQEEERELGINQA